MIAACPKCGARYRIDAARLGEGGARLRCTRCEAVFRVRRPRELTPAPPPRAPLPLLDERPGVLSPSVARAGEAPETRPPPEPAEREGLVLVAHPDPESAGATARALRSWGLVPLLATDGVEAILTIARQLPRAVVLCASLPRMYGFQVCELLKRNESLRSTVVVLVGSVNHRDRYRRPPVELYGADAYIEEPDVPEGLQPILQRFGLLRPSRETPPPEPSPPAAPSSAAKPVQPVLPGPGSTPNEAEEKAARLARIIVSDIILYNEDRFAEAIRRGDVLAALGSELSEGRKLFEGRIEKSIRAGRDHLAEELLRVARKRGAP